MYTIQNKDLSLSISPVGAQICSIQDSKGKEWLWEAREDVWPWHAPLCFPFVGRLNKEQYTHDGRTYNLPIHGFGRLREFTCTEQTPTKISFQLSADTETKKLYPFDFELNITYSLDGNRLTKSHQVNNNGIDMMYYELGGHDAFTIPRKDHYISIPKALTLQSYQQDEDGLIIPQKLFIPQKDGKIPLDCRPHGLDSYLFTNLAERSLTVLDILDRPVLGMDFSDFPYLVLWAKNEEFYCVEPWSSLPDCTYVTSEIKDKIGVRALRAGCGEKMAYTTEFYI